MFETNFLWQLSRAHCVSICSFLVPSILLVTLATIILVIMGKSESKSIFTASFGIFLSLVMLLHVFSWFAIGVVLGPTYMLIALACSCLVINLGMVTIFNPTDSFFHKLLLR